MEHDDVWQNCGKKQCLPGFFCHCLDVILNVSGRHMKVHSLDFHREIILFQESQSQDHAPKKEAIMSNSKHVNKLQKRTERTQNKNRLPKL